ncbi:MAG: hypothetical protein EPN82_02675 [Bacteroidetes bacterium]|nr:MAG: hypothetical protein EPN82_02675 [Bacteroidota bacterium]
MKMIFKTLFIVIIFLFPFQLFSKDNQTRIDVIYFHATIRCHTCLTIENNIRNSLLLEFGKELKDSTVILTSLDFLLPENEHYREKYKFDTQTLIISKKENGKEIQWKNLEKIWDFVNDFEKFKKYIKEEINFIRSAK